MSLAVKLHMLFTLAMLVVLTSSNPSGKSTR
jgi:hypothetical protein